MSKCLYSKRVYSELVYMLTLVVFVWCRMCGLFYRFMGKYAVVVIVYYFWCVLCLVSHYSYVVVPLQPPAPPGAPAAAAKPAEKK